MEEEFKEEQRRIWEERNQKGTIEIYSMIVLGDRRLKSRYQQGPATSKTSRDKFFIASSSLW